MNKPLPIDFSDTEPSPQRAVSETSDGVFTLVTVCLTRETLFGLDRLATARSMTRDALVNELLAASVLAHGEMVPTVDPSGK